MTSSLEARIRYPAWVVGLSAAAFIVIKTGRDALFFGGGGLQALPLALFWTQVGLAAAAYLHVLALRRWGARRARIGLFLGASALFLGCALALGPSDSGLLSLFFGAVPVVFAALFASAWLLAGDLFDGGSGATRAARGGAYARIGASGLAGGVGGGLAARLLSSYVPAGHLVGAGGALLLLAGLVCIRAQARWGSSSPLPAQAEEAGRLPSEAPSESPSEAPSVPPSGRPLWSEPYVRLLLVLGALGGLVALLVEFQFYAAAAHSGRAGAAFFADFYLVVGVSSLALQLLAARRVQARWGLGGALMVLPAAVLGGAGLVTAATTALTQTLFRVTENGLRVSIHQSSWEQAFLPIERERRASLKMLVDGVAVRVSTAAGALALYAAGRLAPDAGFSWMPFAIALAAGLWVLVTSALRRLGCGASGEAELAIRLPDACPTVSALGQRLPR